MGTSSILGKVITTFFALPIAIIALGAQLLVLIFNGLFPKRLQELIPLLEVNATLFSQVALMFSDPERLEAEKALKAIEDVSEQVDEVVRGYALRKGVGQSVDLAVSGFALGALGVFTLISQSSNPALFLYLFGSATMALSTFAGIFGPPYALFEESKNFALSRGNYRGASFYKTLESIFALPFIGSAAGFLLLDMPPVDQETLEDFKGEIGSQMSEVQEKLTTLMGANKSAMSRRTKKMIGDLMTKNQDTLTGLDFRNIREEKAREFALGYYQNEFSIFPWRRKQAVREFAEMHNFTLEEAENTLKLITFKIHAGQEDEDLVNNVMVTGALKGIIMLEQRYSESYEDLELGQISTGLAFGARQFLQDHYLVRTTREKYMSVLQAISLALFAAPYIFLKSFVIYTNNFFDYWVRVFAESEGANPFSYIKMRYSEVYTQLSLMPAKWSKKFKRSPSKATSEETKNRNLQWKRIGYKIGRGLIDFIILPFKILIRLSRWMYLKAKGENIDARAKMAEDLGHAALVSMYNELYLRLVQQSHVSSAF